jgi:hypothetical protein
MAEHPFPHYPLLLLSDSILEKKYAHVITRLAEQETEKFEYFHVLAISLLQRDIQS